MKPLAGMAVAVALASAAGCYRAPDRLGGRAIGSSAGYEQVAHRYNENLRWLGRLWARVEVSVRWHEDGKRQFERGEGHLILDVPDSVALEIGKVGQTGLWVGSNPRQYWVFNLRAAPPELYFGSHERVGERGVQPLPFALQPRDLVKLLGLVPLPTDRSATSPADGSATPRQPPVVQRQGRHLLVELPQRRYRLTLDPRTYLPIRVELLDVDGEPVVTATLSLPRAVRVKGLPSDQWPRWPSRLEARLAGQDDRLTLVFSDNAYAGPQEDRVKPRLFDLGFLADRHFKIPLENRIDLDAER